MPNTKPEAIGQVAKPLFNHRERLFIAAYVKTRKLQASAIEAGYSERSAHVMANELINRPKIKAEIERRIEALVERYEISADNIMRELASIGFGSVDDFIAIQDDGSAIVDLGTATKRQLRSLAGIEVEEYTEGRGDNAQGVKRVKVKLADKRQALMDLAKIARMLPADRLEHSGSIDHHVKPEHKIDIESMDHEAREQLRVLLLRASGEVTDVDDTSEET